MKRNQDTTFVQGDTHYLDVTATHSDRTPVDLTETAIEYTLKKPPSGTPVTKTRGNGITITDAVAGEFEVVFELAETAELTNSSYRHQVELTDSGGDVATILDGNVHTTEDLDVD